MPQSAKPPLDPASDAMFREMRERVRGMFDHALTQCSIPRAFGKNLRCEGGYLSAGSETYDLGGFNRALIISMGKAGHSMAEAFASIVGTGLGGIVACPELPPPNSLASAISPAAIRCPTKIRCAPATPCCGPCRTRHRRR